MLKQIIDGRTDLVFEYLAAGNPVSATDKDGVPLIRWCAYYGDVSAIRFLLSQGETVSSLGPNLDLNGAVFHGHWRLCQFLIESGADVNAALPKTLESPLHTTFCKANRPATEPIVQILLAAGADPNWATKPSAPTGSFMRDCRTRGETPLHRAAAFGSAAAIRALLSAGADPTLADMNGDTPLSWASWHLRPAEILRILSHGPFSLHPQADWLGDHGTGWTVLDASLNGRPHL